MATQSTRVAKRTDSREAVLVKGHGAVMRCGSELGRGDDGIDVPVPIIFGTPKQPRIERLEQELHAAYEGHAAIEALERCIKRLLRKPAKRGRRKVKA